MVGSPVVAAVVAKLGFWVLLIHGALGGELSPKWAGTFVALWLAGSFGLPPLSMFSGLFVPSYVAVLAIALVFHRVQRRRQTHLRKLESSANSRQR